MRQISHNRAGIAARASAAFLALSMSLLPTCALAQDTGSLEDMWQEQNVEAKPAASSETEPKTSSKKSSKKSKKTKPEKPIEQPTGEQDLSKSPTKEASPGWSSPADSSGSDSSATGSAATTTTTEPKSAESGLSRPVTAGTSLSAPSKTTQKSAEPSTPESTSSSVTPTADTSSETGNSSVTAIDGPTQALCKVSELTASDLVKTGGWPGVGPFSKDQNDANLLVDDAKNRLKLKLSGDEVTHAELLLVNQSPKPSQLLALQMTADFLLEAVGAQAGKIADFNQALTQNQDKLTSGSEEGGLSLKAGSYVVQIQKKPAQNDTVPGNVSYLIALDNQKQVLASATQAKNDGPSFSIYTTPAHEPTKSTSPPSSTATPPAKTTTPAKTTPAKTADDLLHRQFTNLITSWQQVKRAAVKSRQSASLTRILGGKALATQNKAIDWLLNSKKYYEMTPLELKVEHYREITPGTKYEVDSFIKERRQLVNADTMKTEKDETKEYTVVYTVEKIRGAWLITDTRIVQ